MKNIIKIKKLMNKFKKKQKFLLQEVQINFKNQKEKQKMFKKFYLKIYNKIPQIIMLIILMQLIFKLNKMMIQNNLKVFLQKKNILMMKSK